MKRFMFASIGVLALAAAFHLGAMTAEGPKPAIAGWVDHSACGIVAAVSSAVVLDESGQVWWLNSAGWHNAADFHDPPVPVSEIKFWTGTLVVTFSNEAWVMDSEQWYYAGTWPGGPSPAEKTTWSQLKSGFK